MEKDAHSFQLQRLFENLDKLSEQAELGSFEANQRLEAIQKLANPIFDFSNSDYRRILEKRLPVPVRKGIELYKMMNQLTYLVQPAGKSTGRACTVNRVDYENLTWEGFLQLRGNFSAGFIMEALKQRAGPSFDGMNMLNDRQKELSQRIRVYFGSRKKPTLQSLAMNLLSEETDGKDFSDRSLYVYLDAITKYQKKRKKAAGFDVLYFTFHAVTSFGSGKSICESLESWNQTIGQLRVIVGQTFTEMGARLRKGMMPNFYEALVSQFQIPKISELIPLAIQNLSNLPPVSEKDTPSK